MLHAVLFSFHLASQGLGTYGDSGIFADDWFGSASPDNGYHTVDKGRWAYLSVMAVSDHRNWTTTHAMMW